MTEPYICFNWIGEFEGTITTEGPVECHDGKAVSFTFTWHTGRWWWKKTHTKTMDFVFHKHQWYWPRDSLHKVHAALQRQLHKAIHGA